MDNSPNRPTLRTWFAFGLRLLGFWEVLVAASYLLTALNISMGFTRSVNGSVSFGSSFGSYMVHTFGHLVIAFWLVVAAPKIALLVYPECRDDENPAKKSSSSDTSI
jgi:hypothetical protein